MSSDGVHDDRVSRLAEVLRARGPDPGPPQRCAYLPDRQARFVAFTVAEPLPGLYHALMDLNYRRSGAIFYRPACDGCSECQAIRLNVNDFRPTRAQRRCWRRNADLDVTLGDPRVSDERWDLYRRYLAARHDGQMDGSRDELAGFLCVSDVDTIEIAYRSAGRLLAVGLADCEPQALSAVYCYFEPALPRRSLGIFNVLWLVQEARRRGLPFLYLGYRVAGSRRMRYKADFRPHERLEADGRWTRFD
jgi:arginyl-tRNA--protein-N-Asp/Glu arginylyltransferase